MRSTAIVNGAETTVDNPPMSLPSEFPPTNDNAPVDDPLAICRWEDDGGAVGREGAHGE